MADALRRMKEIERELEKLPIGYISNKMINGKEKHYLQWKEDGKLKSRYIKESEYDDIAALVEQRKALQAELKALKSTPDGIAAEKLHRKEARNMASLTGALMQKDQCIATVKNGDITEYNEALLPLHLQRTMNLEGWLASRAIDTHRTNSRLLKKALRIRTADDAETALAVNAATITDNYWFRPDGSTDTYDDIHFKENYFDGLALKGDPDGFSHRPSRTPELTNIGSFEKCWKLIDGSWWMYKSGNENEYFSELFISRLGEKLGLDMVHYEMDGDYIRSRNFVDTAKYNFEPASAIMGENDDYHDCFCTIHEMSPALAEQYLKIIWLDTICYNMDRHTENFGFLRSVKNGKVVSMAPNYDNNIALIARGYPSDVTREHDGLIRFFEDFLEETPEAVNMYRTMKLPELTEPIIEECFSEIPTEGIDLEFVKQFIVNGYTIVKNIIEE